MAETKKKNKRMMKLMFAVAALGLLGATAASAVNIGISGTNQLGAGTSVTATCQPAGAGADITVGFAEPTFVPATQKFTVTDVKLANIAAACVGKKYKLVVSNAAGAALGTKNGTVATAAETVTLPAAVDSALVANVSLVIYAD